MPNDAPLSDANYARLADFRFTLRRFLNFSEEAAAAEKLTPQQHQALLVIRGRAEGATTVGILAQRLCLKHHTAVELVQRLEKAGVVTKRASPDDGRVMLIELNEDGRERLDRLTQTHRAELKRLGPKLHEFLSTLNS